MRGVEVYKEKHEFALYVESLSLLLHKKELGCTITFSDEKLVHRIHNVLRLRIGEKCIFFDRKLYIKAQIVSFIGKKQVHIVIQSLHQTVFLRPKITFLLPLLKRDDLEQALYALTEVGVNSIQLIFTQKSGNQCSWDRDGERIERVVIAAAEQSKNFAYPEVKRPISLQAALKEYSDETTKIFFDPEGEKMFEVMHALRDVRSEHVLLLVGPEGDLHADEKKILQVYKFIFCALTPTIIRAAQAAAFAAGFVRALLVSA